MTRPAINDLFWTIGLLLQCGLVALVFLRGIARRLPAFTALIVFYPLRSAALFALFSHIDSSAYAVTYDALSIVDLLLQLLVVAEIVDRLVGSAGGWSSRFGRLLLPLPFVAIAANVLFDRLLPGNTPVHPDRMQLFDWLAMTLLLIATLALTPAVRKASALPGRVALGFGLYGAAGLCVTVARSFAALHHDTRRLAEASYVLRIVWLLVVLYWIAALRPPIPSPSQPPETAGVDPEPA